MSCFCEQVGQTFVTGSWLYQWQTLVTGVMALFAAGLGGYFIHRQITSAERLEAERRRRKFIAARAVLPLTLNAISEYALQSAKALQRIYQQRNEEGIPQGTALGEMPVVSQLAVQQIRELIEYADENLSEILAAMLREIQVQSARLRSMWNNLSSPEVSINATNIETYIVDSGIIYARAASLFSYGRGKGDVAALNLKKEDVTRALRQLGFWEGTGFDRIHERLSRRDELS